MFAAKNGLLIADVSGNLSANTNSWGGRIFSEEEKRKYRDAIDFLTTRGAIVDYKTLGKSQMMKVNWPKFVDFSNSSRMLHCAYKR